ncbi:serine/threonine-protein kinase [uncultured Senegalimassilia sp.]|uniref:serine/threonine-protein kinase n=1 Tax=uncultured Senegalimassilia sp. TaxID=1714350 RepID=UPI002610F029|nr:serine/threonine-protein kinase [uncultured Senegalimassilia sp.]
MNESLQQHLESLARDECYRVDAVLKEGRLERTERVFFVGANGAEQGPYVRKVFEAESGLGGAYGRVLDAQRQGQRFLHLPRIIDCYSLGEQDAVVMEFVPGRTLADELYETGPSLDAAKRLFPGICDAIAELHSRFDPPLIHRDIKPSNFMVEGDTVLVIDLGIARTFDKDAVCDTSHFGTRAYAPPEQFGYGQTDVRSDIYALGMLLFYLLCEETPVPSTVQQRLRAHGAPESVRDVVAQATAFDPADRFGSVAAMLAAFRYAVGQAVSVAEPCAPASLETKERGSFETFAHGPKAAFRWLWEFWAGIAHRLPLGVGVAWDILLAAWCVVMTFACVASGMNPQGDMARLPAVACAVSYVCVWLALDWPIPLLVDTRPLDKLFAWFERPTLKQRVIAAAGMAGVAMVVLTLIGVLFLRES